MWLKDGVVWLNKGERGGLGSWEAMSVRGGPKRGGGFAYAKACQ